jgi:hypothetical protein
MGVSYGSSHSRKSGTEEAESYEGEAKGGTGQSAGQAREGRHDRRIAPSAAIKPGGFCPAPAGFREISGEPGRWLFANGRSCPALDRAAAYDERLDGGHEKGISREMAGDSERGIRWAQTARSDRTGRERSTLVDDLLPPFRRPFVGPALFDFDAGGR